MRGTFGPGLNCSRGGDRLGERAYLSLLSNLHQGPMVDEAQGLHLIHFEAVGPNLSHVIWEYMVPPAETSSNCTIICRNYRPVRTFKRRGGALSVSQKVIPSPETKAYRVHIRFPPGQAGKFSWFGRWNLDSVLMEQYC